MHEFVDRTLTCVDCAQEFIFSAGEQRFFADRNFTNDPKRCKMCKAKRASMPTVGSFLKPETIASCSNCGKQTTIPFRPTQGRPVFCRECFQLRKSAASAG